MDAVMDDDAVIQLTHDTPTFPPPLVCGLDDVHAHTIHTAYLYLLFLLYPSVR